MVVCQIEERNAGRAYPRTCPMCGLTGVCVKGLAMPRQLHNPEDDIAAAIARAEAAEARVAKLDAEVLRLRVALADLSNNLNIIGSPYHVVSNALDQMVQEIKRAARAALRDPDA